MLGSLYANLLRRAETASTGVLNLKPDRMVLLPGRDRTEYKTCAAWL